MKKLFKNAALVVLGALLFVPTLKADDAEVQENDLIYTTYIAKENYLAEGKAAMDYYNGYDNYSIVYKLCLKDSENCIYSDKTESTLTTFEKGKTYVMSAVVSAKEGYEFSDGTTFYMESGSFDEEKIASSNISISEDGKTATLTNIYEVSDVRTPIKEISITNATLNFKVGDSVKFTAASTDERYKVLYEYWTVESSESSEYSEYAYAFSKTPEDYEGSEVKFFTKFEGKKYDYNIVLQAADGYMFAPGAILTVNGKTAIWAGGEIEYYAHGVSSLDLTDTPAEEKNETALNEAIMYTMFYNQYGDGETIGFSEELMNAIANATSASFDLTNAVITDETVKSDAKTRVDALIKDANIASYLDLSIVVTVDGTEAGKVTELYNPVDLIIEVPSDLPKVEAGKLRVYSVVRIHNGLAEEIPTFDNGDGTITITTDKFSTYVLTYKDLSSPATGDNIVTYLIMSALSLIALISLTLVKKSN